MLTLLHRRPSRLGHAVLAQGSHALDLASNRMWSLMRWIFPVANLLLWSENLTKAAWAALSATKDSSTTFTITAQYGQITQSVPTTEGVKYTIAFQGRVVSGNTGMHFSHMGSADGDFSAVTMSGSSAWYAATVNGKSGS